MVEQRVVSASRKDQKCGVVSVGRVCVVCKDCCLPRHSSPAKAVWEGVWETVASRQVRDLLAVLAPGLTLTLTLVPSLVARPVVLDLLATLAALCQAAHHSSSSYPRARARALALARPADTRRMRLSAVHPASAHRTAFDHRTRRISLDHDHHTVSDHSTRPGRPPSSSNTAYRRIRPARGPFSSSNSSTSSDPACDPRALAIVEVASSGHSRSPPPAGKRMH
jgi:hypothetical protein